MASDLLLQVTGPSAGSQVEAAAKTTTSDGTAGGLVAPNIYRNLGKYRTCQAHCRIGGAFVSTGTLAFEIWEADDVGGTNARLVASSGPLTASQAANLGTTGTITLGSQPAVVSFNTGAGGWVKARFTVGGTSPSAAGVSVVLIPTPAGYLRFGT